MRFYTEQHKYYCGIGLQARKMYVCIPDQASKPFVKERFDKIVDIE